MANAEYQVFDVERPQPIQDIFQEETSRNWGHAFWRTIKHGAKPCSKTASQDQRRTRL